jgi:hypothetical protein
MILAGVNDASYNCKGPHHPARSEVIPVATVLCGDETATPARKALRTRLLGSFGVASSEAAAVLWV